MEFDFLSNYNINIYPEISPLVFPHHPSDPFYIKEEEEDSQSFLEITPSPLVQEGMNKTHTALLENQNEKLSFSDSLEISPKISGILQSNLFEENESLNEIEDKNKQNSKSTNLTTDKSKKGKIQIKKIEEPKEKEERKDIFGLKTKTNEEILPRIDYAIKNFKVSAVKFIKEYGNKLIKECKFKGELKNLKLFSPSNKYFTGISNEKDNKIFLDFTVEEFFSYPNLEFGKENRLQQNNKKIIEKMKNFINNFKSMPKEYEQLKHFFDITFADAITLFYNTENFLKYKEDPKTKFLDSQFEKVKGFSLLEPNSFIRLMKHTNNN